MNSRSGRALALLGVVVMTVAGAASGYLVVSLFRTQGGPPTSLAIYSLVIAVVALAAFGLWFFRLPGKNPK